LHTTLKGSPPYLHAPHLTRLILLRKLRIMERTVLLRKQEKALAELLYLREKTTALNEKDMKKQKASCLTDLVEIRAALAKMSGSDVTASPAVRQRKLLDKVADKKKPAAPSAKADGKPPTAAEEKKAQVEHEKELKALRSELEKVQTTAEAKDSNKALFSAAISSGDLDFIQLCFEEGLFSDGNFALDQDGTTPMHKAAFSSQLDVIRLLADKADVNSQTKRGSTPLMMVSNLEVARCLVEELKANTNAINITHKSALHIAAYAGDLGMVQMLVENGADVYKKDKNGRTALFMPCVKGQYDVAKYLCDFHDAEEVQMADNEGVSPLVYARMGHHYDIVRYIENKIRAANRK
jgi:hypothetical protein